MEAILLALASELTGLESARKLIEERIGTIQRALTGQANPTVIVTGPKKRIRNRNRSQAATPISDAKRQALEKARAALAARRQPPAGKKRALAAGR